MRLQGGLTRPQEEKRRKRTAREKGLSGGAQALREAFPAGRLADTFRPMPTPIAARVVTAFAAAWFTLAVALPARAADEGTPVFNGKDLTGWKFKQKEGSEAWKVVGDVKLDPADPRKLVAAGDGSGGGQGQSGVLLRGPIEHGSDVYTEKEFGDCELHLEFVVPQRSNSGVYLMGRYEVQVLDSFGKSDEKLGQGDVGAIYSAAKPSKNAAKKPGEWQTFHIVFQAPRFDASGKKTQNAKFLSIKLNGVEIQKDVEVLKPTGGQLYNDEKPTGPLLFQGDHGIVAFRNVRVKETGKQ